MTENSKLHRFFTVEYKGTIYFRFDTYGPEYTVWMKVDKADQVDNVDVYNFLERVYENVDLNIIKECRQTGKTRTTTKKLLEKAYYEQMTKEIDISKVLIEGDQVTIMGVKYKRVEEPKPETLFDVIHNLGYSVDMCYEIVDAVEEFEKSKEYQPTPQELKENELVERLKKNPPKFLKFELGRSLDQLIERWWCDVFVGPNEKWTMEECIADLCDRIHLWLPKEQSAAGSQNAYVECSVEGFNDAIKKIKSKLRNKKET